MGADPGRSLSLNKCRCRHTNNCRTLTETKLKSVLLLSADLQARPAPVQLAKSKHRLVNKGMHLSFFKIAPMCFGGERIR